ACHGCGSGIQCHARDRRSAGAGESLLGETKGYCDGDAAWLHEGFTGGGKPDLAERVKYFQFKNATPPPAPCPWSKPTVVRPTARRGNRTGVWTWPSCTPSVRW